MAAPVGSQTAALERNPVAASLGAEPWRFEFYQAVRLLHSLLPSRAVVGRFAEPDQEVVRFGAHASTAFPPSPIQALTALTDEPPRMTVNFFGLFGPSGQLPLCYTDFIRERTRRGDRALADFLDIFNHRAISLLYRAWEKYRIAAASERQDTDRFTEHLLDIAGLGSPELQDRQEVPDRTFVFYGGLLGPQTRSATALEQLVADYFDVPTEIEQFIGTWRRVSDVDRCCLGERNTDSEKIGLGAMIGAEVYDRTSRIRIRLGPLSWARYADFLPGGRSRELLNAIVRFYAGDTLEVEVQLALQRDDVPPCELDLDKTDAPRLGWSTWIKSAAFERDPDEAILRLV